MGYGIYVEGEGSKWEAVVESVWTGNEPATTVPEDQRVTVESRSHAHVLMKAVRAFNRHWSGEYVTCERCKYRWLAGKKGVKWCPSCRNLRYKKGGK